MVNIDKNNKNQTEYIKKLEETCKSQEAEITLLKNQIAWMMEQMKLSKHKQFGASSEKSEYDQLSFFNEAEKEVNKNLQEPTIEEIEVRYKRKKKVGKKEENLKGLPVTVKEYFLSDEEAKCPKCFSSRHIMGKHIRKELKIVPAKVEVVEHVTHTYACRNCDKNGEQTPISKSKAVEPVILGSIASPSIVAYIMSQKYVNAIPLYRQEKEFERLGVDLSRQTMANWVIRCSDDWLFPIYNLMKEKLLEKDILHADETTLQVLKESGKPAQSKSYMWLYRTSGSSEENIVLYEYQPDRAYKRPAQFLKGFKGYLHADGYEAYHKLPDDIIILGCFSHCRRKFDEALKSIKPAEQIGSKALQGKNYCDKLFKIERSLVDLSPEERFKKRNELSKPILDEFYAWLKNCNALPKSALGKAVTYALNQWEYLNNYLLDGRTELSNNRAERSIKPFVIGRKNFLFSATARGAKASATIYSIVETAKENRLNPMKYLEYLFKKMPNIDFRNDPQQLEELLPWAKLPMECYISGKES
ncbi:MAG: IS66 family transposase [Tepidibacter sp.]|jgi:transposase|uniref:IS66 family transposase n=1 Tax=Tepidibacter sp. TaxID=2529387 RepID=UPI0025F2EA39|nr:IS66 family transposase [Tepidibacter sp.]MCT4507216.1 IS66 family transposase [Tepidibacter sp.]